MFGEKHIEIFRLIFIWSKYSITDQKYWVKNKHCYIFNFVYLMYQTYFMVVKIAAEDATMIVMIVQTKNCNLSSLKVDRT